MMIFIMKHGATEEQVSRIVSRIERWGCQAHLSEGKEHIIIGVVGDVRRIDEAQAERIDGVERVMRVMKPFKLAGREFHPLDTIVEAGGVKIGNEKVVIMAGPCAVENYDMMIETARAVKRSGAHILRGGAYKPRTSPYSFQGMGEEGLKILAAARRAPGWPA